MIACPTIPYNFAETYAVVVSGDGPNFCGHLMLRVGLDGSAMYMHVAGMHLTHLKLKSWTNFPQIVTTSNKSTKSN